MKYFFDNCISYRFAKMLAALEEFDEVVALRDKFSADTDDLTLFRELKNSDYVFVTTDERQKTREHEASRMQD